MPRLTKIALRGFKSIKDAELQLRPLNVLIGANGAGKSNLISFFKMLNEMLGGRLQQFIATSGRSKALLRFGPKVTPQIESNLEFETEQGTNRYHARLFHAAGDTLIFAEESLFFTPTGWQGGTQGTLLGAGHSESRVLDEAESGKTKARVFRHLLNRCRVYHFHDTSPTARVRQFCYLGNNSWLMPDAGNLAAVLYRMREGEHATAYRSIVSTLRLIAPFFDDFELSPEGPAGKDIILNWREQGSDEIFGPHQLSDGTLRAICLVTLLLQPAENLPDLIVVDEPELGLHPYALQVIASLFCKAAHHAQLLISTQSSSFLSFFEPEDMVIVDRHDGGSTFVRPDPEKLASWLEEYTLGEIWEKNVVGGGPH